VSTESALERGKGGVQRQQQRELEVTAEAALERGMKGT
jgi:hypothetical protein